MGGLQGSVRQAWTPLASTNRPITSHFRGDEQNTRISTCVQEKKNKTKKCYWEQKNPNQTTKNLRTQEETNKLIF
jgi:hypothetical protein